jgi:hypothetical protein
VAEFVAWVRQIEGPGDEGRRLWRKTSRVRAEIQLPTPRLPGEPQRAGQEVLTALCRQAGAPELRAEVQAEIEEGKLGPELVVTLVNTSPEIEDVDTYLYEAVLRVDAGETLPFVLDDLPDSFRYDRRVDAYGVHCGVLKVSRTQFETTDVATREQPRPEYWDAENLGPEPELTFAALSRDPLPHLHRLVRDLRIWGRRFWSEEELRQRQHAEGWSEATFERAMEEGHAFWHEVERVEAGLRLLQEELVVLRAFTLMNRAFLRARLRHDRWRPFQIGFILATLPSVRLNGRGETETVDTLWFPTGGGKTETYLGLSVIVAFLDRLRGKYHGITSWARFPLRMLSLQQTQRFADVLAAAELVRQEEGISGDVFSAGFLVGPGTPNRIPADPRPGDPNPDDPEMARQWRILLRCPFCGSDDVQMAFDRNRWTLDHQCANGSCPWRGPLPFRIVDDEIFRFLPTMVVGTLDKAANVSLQAAMRGFYGAPLGRCPRHGHGFTYARRSRHPHGCLVPGCNEVPAALGQEASLFPPTIRIQDELHLLRDSLGAIDAHYESLVDDLQRQFDGVPAILASSATVAGHDEQVATLYRRPGRLFPQPGPRTGLSFWTKNSGRLGRLFIGVAPRGVTLDYAADRANEALQRAVRRALEDPAGVAQEARVHVDSVPELASFYGVGVVYGATLRDVEAAARSFETQIPLEPINAVTLTGRTPLEEVREALARLTNPEPDFNDRIHLVAASSMLSHGVDLDRLNIMVMLGLPLSTAEFIQATSRVGRLLPALVLVLHKIGRERDAKVFRSFPQFVEHADRLIDPVPITRRSRRVLELTFPGLFMGRVYGVHEPAALARGFGALTTPRNLRRAFQTMPVLEEDEYAALVALLGATGPLDEGIRNDIREYVRQVFRGINDPATPAQFVTDLMPLQPMRSLRDVEEQVPVYSRGGEP